MNGKLSTHVLDNYFGRPAEGVDWTLSKLNSDGVWNLLSTGKTNSDGRTDAPLLLGSALETGTYRIDFRIDDYYTKSGAERSDPPFLDEIPIVVNLVEGQNYHVPLLMTPWSYSTYRGS